VYRRDLDTILIDPCPARRPLTLSESPLNGSRGPRPTGTGSCRNWAFDPTGLFDPVTIPRPEAHWDWVMPQLGIQPNGTL